MTGDVMRFPFLSAVAALALAVPAHAVAPAAPSPFAGTTAIEGLLPVHVDRSGGRILLTLPPAGTDGVSARYLYATALRTGLGSAPTFLDRLLGATLPDHTDALSRRIAYRTIVTMAQVARRPGTTPEVAAILDSRVHDVAGALARRKGDAADQAWASSLSRQLLDPQERERLLADRPRAVDVPPGDPIGGESDWMDRP